MQSISKDNLIQIVEEINNLNRIREDLKRRIESTYRDYEKGKFDYLTYKKKLNKLLNGKTKKALMDEFLSFEYSLIKRLEYEIDRIIYHYYNEKVERIVAENKPALQPKIVRTREFKEEYEEREKTSTKLRGLVREKVRKEEIVKPVHTKKHPKHKHHKIRTLLTSKLSIITSAFKHLIMSFSTRIKLSKIKISKKHKKSKKHIIGLKQRKLRLRRIRLREPELETKGKKRLLKPTKEHEKSKKIFFTLPNPFALLKRKAEKAKEIIGDKTELPVTIESLRSEGKESVLEKTYLKKEAERVQKIIEKERVYKGYKTTTLASIANVTVKKISIKLLETFPYFFKNFYRKLREANIGVLSNTYLNIMVFFTILTFLVGTFISTIIFYILYEPLYMIIIKSLITGSISAFIIAMIFYTNPDFIIRTKRRSMNQNMPFAINHMAAIASSGVPPLSLFKLIAEKHEYGEFSEQIGRIVDYVELFGIDLLMAIKTVAKTTPSPYFKEFLEGFSSTIESGGGIKNYLKQKAKESMLKYNLERKKYTTMISTFSDIYTAVLVAGPLLFIATLSLVNILGGNIGGVDISTIMMIGTYILIPLLNILFIVFIKITQPGI